MNTASKNYSNPKIRVANIRCKVVLLAGMSIKSQNERIILGLKVKQLRQQNNLSFADLAKQTGMSVSYLNEIEKGKKYPKRDKLVALAEVLNVSFYELTSAQLHQNLAPVNELLRSNFLNELPLDLFGIELNKVVEIIANAPARVGAFISTLVELSRNYALREENFYFGALRSYLELHDNYFEEIEEKVEEFVQKYSIPVQEKVPVEVLHQLLEKEFGYTIIENGLKDYPDLQSLRSVFVPKTRKLLLNGKLTPLQRAFQYGKELGFNYLNLQDRANTSSLLRVRTFEEVLNHSKAVYFSDALLMNRERIVADMAQFFQLERWDGEAFLNIMRKYGASPEMFYHRLTNILPRFFQLGQLFFLRFLHDPATEYFEIDRELHLSRRHHPHSNGLYEHYCRRWEAISLLEDLHAMQQKGQYAETIVGAQRSHYFDTEDEYLCLTIARPAYPTPNQNVSVTLGLLLTDELRQHVRFLQDPAIQRRIVNKTCERCPIENCLERAAPPTIVEQREKRRRMQEALMELMR